MRSAIEQIILPDSETRDKRGEHRLDVSGGSGVRDDCGRRAGLIDDRRAVHTDEDVGLVLRQANDGKIDVDKIASSLLVLTNGLLAADNGAVGSAAEA